MCYLTELYIGAFKSSNTYSLDKIHHFVFHENLHDTPSVDVEKIFRSLNLQFDFNLLSKVAAFETSSAKFGRASIGPSISKLKSFITHEPVSLVLESTTDLYCHIIG